MTIGWLAAFLGAVVAGVVTAGAGQPAHGAPTWSGVAGPSSAPSQAIGGGARGCLAGAVAMPVDGPGFQLMRLSRDRIYGHPRLIAFVKRLATEAQALGWPGLLVGDLAQPRGGPMPSGHRSHQNGLDVDIWLTPAPPATLSREQRETLAATSVVAADGRSVEAQAWTPTHQTLLRAAAEDDDVDRIFVHAAIKKALCASAGSERGWLRKIRPWWGHDAHFHVRLACPATDRECEGQDPPPPGDGCDASLEWWFSEEAAAELRKPKPPPRQLTLDDLPPACRDVLYGG